MRRGLWARLAVGFLLFCATPGADELVLDALHLVVHGHVSDGAAHEHLEDDNDCCSGLFHLCACHHQVARLGESFERLSLTASVQRLGLPSFAVLRLRGHRVPPYRPPNA